MALGKRQVRLKKIGADFLMSQKQSKTYKLYDQTIWIAGIGLLILTHQTLSKSYPPVLQLAACFNIALIWIIALFKIWKIDVSNDKTIIFRGVLRKITVSAEDIVAFQDWLRGIRVVLKGKSIILWPFIGNHDQFKSLLSRLNPNITIVDECAKAANSGKRVFWLMLVFFLYLAGYTAWLFIFLYIM